MRNIAFVIWMIGFPVACSIGEFVNHYCQKFYSEDVETIAAMISFIIYLAFAIKLWEKK